MLVQALLSSKKFIKDTFLDKLVFEKSFILDKFEEVHTLFVVLIEFDIDTDGSVIDPYVVESEPAGLFERAAMKSIRKWLYEPPVYEGVSVKVNDVQVKLTFKVQ
mgnify:CR=1 FL=1